MGGDKPVEGGPMMQRKQVRRTWSKVGIVYPSGGETDDGDEVDYEVGALLLAKVLNANVYTFSDRQSLSCAIEQRLVRTGSTRSC
jgi:hypothetical protein